MAMCLSLAAFNRAAERPACRCASLDPRCVAKTFPDYFETLFGVVADRCRRDIPVITVDGPTASGKGTLASAVARASAGTMLDSGALYRRHRAGGA